LRANKSESPLLMIKCQLYKELLIMKIFDEAFLQGLCRCIFQQWESLE